MEDTVLNVSVDATRRKLCVADGSFSNASPISFSNDRLNLENQNHVIVGCPAVSMLHGEFINDLDTSLHVENYHEIANFEPLCTSSQFERYVTRDSSLITSYAMSDNMASKQLMDPMPFRATSLSAPMYMNCIGSNNLNDFPAFESSMYPSDVGKSFIANEYADTLNDSCGSLVNWNNDGVLGELRNKWDFNNFIAPSLFTDLTAARTESQPFHVMEKTNADGWIPSDNAAGSFDPPSTSARFSNELSPNLFMHQPPVIYENTVSDHGSEMSCSAISGNSLTEERQSDFQQTSYFNKSLSLGFGSFTSAQDPLLVSGSSYLHVMQEILAEIADFSLGNENKVSHLAIGTGMQSRISTIQSDSAQKGNSGVGSEFSEKDERFEIQVDPNLKEQEVGAKKKHLLALLQVVDDRYSQCLDEIHTVVSAFRAVSELDPRVHVCFALQTLSSLYKELREKISKRILLIEMYSTKPTRCEELNSFQTDFIQRQWALQQLRRKDNQLWKPQRGLPERSVSVLRAWMFQNFLHPYPKDTEKHLLAVRSGLTRSQVTNWFINARVRLWKPMIEEMYLEMNRKKNCKGNKGACSRQRTHLSIHDDRRF